MRVNFSTALKTLNGEEIKRGEEPLRLSNVACDALFATFEDEKNLSGDDKAKRFVLATKIHDQGAVDLNVEELSLLKKLIGKAFSALIVGQAFALLDPKPALVEGESKSA